MTIWTLICNILAVEPDAPWYTHVKVADDTIRNSLSDEDDTYPASISTYSVVGQSLWTYSAYFGYKLAGGLYGCSHSATAPTNAPTPTPAPTPFFSPYPSISPYPTPTPFPSISRSPTTDDDDFFKFDDDDNFCKKNAYKQKALLNAYTDDRIGNDDDDEWKNIVPESEAAAAFNLLSAIVCIVAITYTTYALCVSKRIKMMELGLSASFLFCSICLIITSAVVSVTLSEVFDDDDDDDKIPAGSPTPSPTASSYSFYAYSSTELTIKSDCSLGCIFSVIGAVWEFIVAIVWLVYAGTCKKEYFEKEKADWSEPSMASNIA
jgi:hypothetical protein